jgi:hypothetical protein
MKYTLLTFLAALNLFAFSQDKKITTLEVSDTIQFAAVDRPGELYILTNAGQLQKFDYDGKLLNLLKTKFKPTLFDPRDGSRLFAYYRDIQQYWFYNPSLEVTSMHELDSALAIDPWLVCSSGDYALWMIDATDNSLKKIDTKSGLLTVEVSLPTPNDKSEFIYMREYQGFLFVLTRTQGIYIFNSIGKLIKTIPGKNITYFNFLGEELYYPAQDHLVFMDLFSGESRQVQFAHGRYVLFTDERAFVIGVKQIDIYSAPLQH